MNAVTAAKQLLTNKNNVLESITRELSKPYEGFLRAEGEEILNKQASITGYLTFAIGTDVYVPGYMPYPAPKTSQLRLITPDPSIQEEVYAFLKHRGEFEQDMRKITSVLRSMLARVDNLQGIRDMLPDNLLNSVKLVTGQPFTTEVPRQRPSVELPPRPAPDTPELEEWHDNLRAVELLWSPEMVMHYADVVRKINFYRGFAIV